MVSTVQCFFLCWSAVVVYCTQASETATMVATEIRDDMIFFCAFNVSNLKIQTRAILLVSKFQTITKPQCLTFFFFAVVLRVLVNSCFRVSWTIAQQSRNTVIKESLIKKSNQINTKMSHLPNGRQKTLNFDLVNPRETICIIFATQHSDWKTLFSKCYRQNSFLFLNFSAKSCQKNVEGVKCSQTKNVFFFSLVNMVNQHIFKKKMFLTCQALQHVSNSRPAG